MYNNNNFQKTTGRSRDVPLVPSKRDYQLHEIIVMTQNFADNSHKTTFIYFTWK